MNTIAYCRAGKVDRGKVFVVFARKKGLQMEILCVQIYPYTFEDLYLPDWTKFPTVKMAERRTSNKVTKVLKIS